MGSEKMSKSLGNVTLVHDLLKEWDGEVIRLALLKAHYRSELSWSEDLLKESKAQLDRWYGFLNDSSDIQSENAYDFISKEYFEDLNGLKIISYISHLADKGHHSVHALKSGNREWEKNHDVMQIAEIEIALATEIPFARGDMIKFGNLLGLLQKDPEDWFKGGASSDDQAEFDAIALRRQEARAAKDWAAADAARDEAAAKGIVLEDGPDGTTWRKA